LLHQVGDLFELNVKGRCQKVKGRKCTIWDKVISKKRGAMIGTRVSSLKKQEWATFSTQFP
jgi:hypothetical protein